MSVLRLICLWVAGLFFEGLMAGFIYRDFGAGSAWGAGQDDDILARLRADQLRRALREASGLTVPRAARAAAPPPVSGQILDADDTGGDSARVIFAGGYGDSAGPLQNPACPQEGPRPARRR